LDTGEKHLENNVSLGNVQAGEASRRGLVWNVT